MKVIVDFIEIGYKIKVKKFVVKFINDKNNNLYFIGIF